MHTTPTQEKILFIASCIKCYMENNQLCYAGTCTNVHVLELGSVPPPGDMVAQKCLIQTVLNGLLATCPNCNHLGWDFPGQTVCIMVSTFEIYWRQNNYFIMTDNKSDQSENFYCPCLLEDELWIGMGAAFISEMYLIYSLLKCCLFSLPNYKPSKNCHLQMLAAHFLKAQSWFVWYPCKPGVIHSLSNRMSHAIAVIGCTGLCYLFVPELSTGTVHAGALGSLPRQ